MRLPRWILPSLVTGFLALTTFCASAQTAPTVRLRGTLEKVTPTAITVKVRGTGEVVDLALGEKLVVSEVYPIQLSDIAPNSFIGTAALPQPDGTLKAIAVTVFPESARGVGEGHRPFDLAPDSTMTNATVADVMAAPTGRTMKLSYKGGEKTLVVPSDATIVTFRPGDRSLLVPGASISLAAQEIGGKPTALRVNAGKNGFALPY